MSFVDLLFVYIFGGVTFLPLLLACVLLLAHLTFPTRKTFADTNGSTNEYLKEKDDDLQSIKSGKEAVDWSEKFKRVRESDVASGYFAVCREYVPGGVNGKPPERPPPVSSNNGVESPSVYQSMYRSLFDRKVGSTLDPGASNGRTVKGLRNMFFVVLRHGHLMLYESSEQLEVKFVISLDLHNVSVYSGEETTPEGELWIKRNAIRLSRKEVVGDETSKPFFFFSDNSSEKEDFYFALLQNQEIVPGSPHSPPRPLRYEQGHIIGLVQRLHSSEEQLQTRWINALAGRLFLALYKTSEVEDFVRRKITKKIARVKKPTFLSNIVLQKIVMGDGAPHVTNPRLKDFTIDGDCCVEGDFKYSGNFRIEIATTARIDLGSRFKAREVNLLLAIVVKKLSGHGLLKFKPPPSNRVWIAFESMPDMELAIEPIVSSRQITWGFILRSIEARVREVLAETMVLPFWDDVPFTDTANQEYRSGIWTDNASTSLTNGTKIPDEAPEDEAEVDTQPSVAPSVAPSTPLFKDQKMMSTPALVSTPSPSIADKPSTPLSTASVDLTTEVSSAGSSKRPAPPKALRSRSFAAAANPLLSMDTANVVEPSQAEGTKRKIQQDATSAMMALSSKTRPSSPPEVLSTSPTNRATTWHARTKSGEMTSNESTHSSGESEHTALPSALNPSGASSLSSSGTSKSFLSEHSGSVEKRRSWAISGLKQPIGSLDKKQAVASIGAATETAKNWGWGVLNRNAEQKNRKAPDPDREGTPNRPIGRGQPFPPPGQPLPFPDGQRSKATPLTLPKRKPLTGSSVISKPESPKIATPPLPARRRQMSIPLDDNIDEGLLVVEAPPDSEPSSPIDSVHDAGKQRHDIEDDDANDRADDEDEGEHTGFEIEGVSLETGVMPKSDDTVSDHVTGQH